MKRFSLSVYEAALQEAHLLQRSSLRADDKERDVACLTYDTHTVAAAAMFVCKGAHFKEEYLRQALQDGAIAYVSETEYDVAAPCLLVSDIRRAMVVLAMLFYDRAPEKVTSAGITGTKGKSTVAYYLRAILDDWLLTENRKKCAVLSSIDVYDGVVEEESHITTPEILELHQHFRNAYDSGISHLVMEVSSQALKYGRVRDIVYDVACFTNIGTDHISPIEHPDFEDYYRSKLMIFDACRVGCVNTDADYAGRTLAYAKERCAVLTFGSHETDDFAVSDIKKEQDGIWFTVKSAVYNGRFSITMPGLFNVSNAMAALTMASALHVPEEFVRSGLRRARAAGRMQVYESADRKVAVIVDYAHNRMSFDALYRSTKLEYPGYDMISVFGCPGRKALLRRKDLGELSGQNCAFVYITEEDSGEEPFASIAADIEQYVACPHLCLEDRGECIRRAIFDHPGKHVVLLTGKGEETRMKRGLAYIDYPSDVEWTLRFLTQYDKKEG